MSFGFGLDVGNTTTCLAVLRDGRVDVVANDAGDRVTAAVVAWAENEVLVGSAARQWASRYPKSAVVYGNKSILGCGTNEDAVQERSSDTSGASLVLEGAEPIYIVNLPEGSTKSVSPREVHTHILRKTHEIALSHATTDADEKSTVLAVPLSFDAKRREVAADCARKAGFHVVQVISEPAAACLAYGLGQVDSNESLRCVVFRVGGTSLSCSVVLVNAGLFSICSNVEKPVGGETVTKKLADFLAEEFQRKYKVDPRESKRGRQKLLTHAETVKHVLSTLETSHCHIESLCDGVDFNASVTRARLENELSKVLPDFLSPIHDALSKCGLTAADIDRIILSGGTARIPRLQKAVADIFPNAQMLSSISPDEVIALGAATQAGLLQEKWNADEIRPQIKALSSSIVYTVGDSSEAVTLIPRLCPVPVRRSHHLETQIGSSVRVSVWLQTGEKGQRQQLAELSLDDLGAENKVSISAHVHREGGTHLVLAEKVSGKTSEASFEAPKKQ